MIEDGPQGGSDIWKNWGEEAGRGSEAVGEGGETGAGWRFDWEALVLQVLQPAIVEGKKDKESTWNSPAHLYNQVLKP